MDEWQASTDAQPEQGAGKPPLSPFSQRVVRNTLFNLFGRLGTALAPLILTPYTIHVLGLPLFGVWALVTSVVSYLSLSDFGVATSLSRCAAREQAEANTTGLSRLLVVGIIYYTVVGAGIVLIAWVLASPILDLVGIPADMHQQARWILIASTVVLAYGQVLRVSESLLIGLQLMDVSSSISLVGTILDIVVTVTVLSLGYGLPGLVIADGLLALFLGVGCLVMLCRLQPGITIRLNLANRGTLRELLSFGLRIEITRLAELTAINIDKLLLGHFVGIQIVAEYEVASRVVRMVKYLALTVTSALMPAATVLQTLGQENKVLSLYYRSSKYLVLVAAPSSVFLIAAAPTILLAWVGPGYGRAVLILQALALGHFVHTLTSAGTTIVRGTGKPEYETRYAIVLLIADAMLGLGLIGTLGYAGAIVATPLALIISSLYFFIIFHRLSGASFGRLLRVYSLPCATSAGLAVALWLALSAASRLVPPAARWAQLVILLLAFACYIPAYALVIWRRGYLDQLDWTLIRRYVPARVGRDDRQTRP